MLNEKLKTLLKLSPILSQLKQISICVCCQKHAEETLFPWNVVKINFLLYRDNCLRNISILSFGTISLFKQNKGFFSQDVAFPRYVKARVNG